MPCVSPTSGSSSHTSAADHSRVVECRSKVWWLMSPATRAPSASAAVMT